VSLLFNTIAFKEKSQKKYERSIFFLQLGPSLLLTNSYLLGDQIRKMLLVVCEKSIHPYFKFSAPLSIHNTLLQKSRAAPRRGSAVYVSSPQRKKGGCQNLGSRGAVYTSSAI
jgi:hypothetical protein